MEDNSRKLTVIIFLLCGMLLFMASVWLVPNIYITRSYTSETISHTLDRTKITVNWTAKYKAPLIFPRQARKDAESKIQMYGEARIHTFARTHIAIILYNLPPTELQLIFDETDGIREIIKIFDDKIDNVKSVKLNRIDFDITEKKESEPADGKMLTTLVTRFK